MELKVEDTAFRATLGEPAELEDEDEFEDEGGEEQTPDFGPRQETVRAPVVGYLRLLEDGPAEGDRVEKGQLIAEVTALDLANDVNAPVSGKLVSYEAASGDAVEYGQAVAVIEVEL